MRTLAAIIIAVLLLCVPSKAYGEPLVLPGSHIKIELGDALLETYNQQLYVIPKGTHILVPEEWERLDQEMQRLQEREITLDAENQSLRDSANQDWRFGWKTLLIVAGIGVAGGAYMTWKLSD